MFGLTPFSGKRPHLAVKLAGCWAMFSEEKVVDAELLRTAMSLLELYRGRLEERVNGMLSAPANPADLMEKVREMCRKVKSKGSCSRRELYRSYRKQRKSEHEPVLEHALELGLLQERGGKLTVCGKQESCQPGRPSINVSDPSPADNQKVKAA
jgi:hypothetical protein